MGKDQDAPKSVPGRGLTIDILGKPSELSCLLPRKKLSHGEFETKEKVLLKNHNEAQPRKKNRQAWPWLPEYVPPLCPLALLEPKWADGRTTHVSAEWWGHTRQ